MLYYTCINAQNKISGTITDQNQQVLSGVNVFIPELNKGTVSNSEGVFELKNLPDGNFKIQYSFVGYTSNIEMVELSGNDLEINVTLQQTAIETEEIVVSGGYNLTQHENAVKIDVLKLNSLSLKSSPNFMENITSIPGVDMISKGSGVSKPVIRGLSMNDVLVLNNGARFENYQYSSHHPLGIDEFGIGKVEIIKGPASLLYGADAIGGVINFIKENPAPVNTIQGDYNLQMFSNTLGMNNNLGLKGTAKKFFWGIRAGHKTNADFIQGNGSFAPNSRFNEKSVKLFTGITDIRGVFRIFYDFNNQKLGLVEDEAIEEIAERGRNNHIFYQELSTHMFSSKNKLYLGRMKLDLNAAFQNTELTHIGEENVYEIQMKLATLSYETKLHLPLGEKSENILGMQGINQVNTNVNNRETILLPDAISNNYSLYNLVQLNIIGNLKLQTGIRYDRKYISAHEVGLITDTLSFRPSLSKSYGSWSGSVGITYKFNSKFIIRANIASAYRTPNLAELTSKGQHELRFEIGDHNLEPENSDEADISLHYHTHNFTFDIAGFYNKVNNFIFISPTGDTVISGIYIYKYKQADSHLYGGEAGFHFHPKSFEWFHLSANYSTVTGKQNKGDYLPFIPANKTKIEIQGKKGSLLFMKNVFISMNMEKAFNQNKAAPDESVSSGYILFGINTGFILRWNQQPFEFDFSINNLFNEKYIDHLSTLKEVSLLNPGRNFTFSLGIPFELSNRK